MPRMGSTGLPAVLMTAKTAPMVAVNRASGASAMKAIVDAHIPMLMKAEGSLSKHAAPENGQTVNL